MGAFFGKSKKPSSRVTEQDNAVLKLKLQRDEMKQYQKNITHKLEKEKELARKLIISGKKDRAKLLLKKKRYLESLMEKSEKQLDNIEEMCQSIEFAQMEMKVVESLERGNESLKKLHAIMSIEDIERVLEETSEGLEKQNEIDALLGNNLSPADLEEVETELEKIMAEENIVNKEPSVLSPTDSVTDVPSLPQVPDSPLPLHKEKEHAVKGSAEKVMVAAS